MGTTKRASVAAVAIPNRTVKVHTSRQGTVTGSGLPVSGSEQRSCLSSQLRKTKICVYHMKGACQYGDACAFAHSCAELQSIPDLRKTRLCEAFAQGGCNNKNCSFAHGDEELRSANLFHKKTLCIWNQKGKCRNGDQCRFAHGTSELRVNQGGNGGQGSHGATPASGQKVAAKGGNGVTTLKEPMKVLPAGCLPAPRPAVLPATLPTWPSELDQTELGGMPPGLPLHPDVYGGLKDFTLPATLLDSASAWQWPPSHDLSPKEPKMVLVPGAGLEKLNADFEHLHHSILNNDIASELERLREDVANLTQKWCNAIQMQHELPDPSLSAAYLKGADPTVIGSYLSAAPGLEFNSADADDKQLPIYWT